MQPVRAVRPAAALEEALARIDGRGYKAYRDILGCYDFGDFVLAVDYVQADPFAAPSKLRALVPASSARVPSGLLANAVRRRAAADYLLRCFADAVDELARGRRGSGRSGLVVVDRPGPVVLE
ncbi:MAG: ATPase, partial [Clostridia bacterium]|nr:ATPase [Clostridia bacterium]